MGRSVLYLQTKSVQSFLSLALLHSLLTLLLSLYLPCSSLFLPFILSSCSLLTFIIRVFLRTPYSIMYSSSPTTLFPYPSCTSKCYTYTQMHAYDLQQASDSQILYPSVSPVILTKIFNFSSLHSHKRGNVRATYQRGAFSLPLLQWKSNTYYIF